MPSQNSDIKRSIRTKKYVAVTGLLLVLFVIAHLAGNLLILGGSDAFNGYAQKLENLGIILKIAEWGLFFLFLLHVERTTALIFQKIRAAGSLKQYKIENSRAKVSLSERLMPISGIYLLVYLIWHLLDFTWSSHTGNSSFLNGTSYGLYGVVVNTFKNPVHTYAYVLAMFCLGLHLAHGLGSSIQVFAFKDERFNSTIKLFSNIFSIAIALAYSSIPLYVLYILKI